MLVQLAWKSAVKCNETLVNQKVCNTFLILDALLPWFDKGQIKSEWIYEVDIFPNYQRKNLMDFCPASLCRLGTYVVIQGNSTHSGVYV